MLGIGTDIVEIARVRLSLERFGERFAARILTVRELEEFASQRAPERLLAKRFAAKEAAAKALGTGFAGGVSWRDLELRHDERGAPIMHLSGAAGRLARERGATRLMISLADEQAWVVAFALLSA